MGGIINYFHGEQGFIADYWWGPFGDKLAFHIEISEDPLHAMAFDYGADIGIDPIVSEGDPVVYLRLDSTTGVWVRTCDQQGTFLDSAIRRICDNRIWIDQWIKHSQNIHELGKIAEKLFQASGKPLRHTIGGLTPDMPTIPATFFLSYSSVDSLLARQIYDDMTFDAKINVWFDLAQAILAAPDHETAVAKWLEESVWECEGFILVLTQSAIDSGWVRQEIEFALRTGTGRRGFQLLILKADDVELPLDLRSAGKVIDLDRIWWSKGISEELFAAVYNWEGRREWLSRKQGKGFFEEGTLRYDDFATDAGTVVSFNWASSTLPHSDFCSKNIAWSLEYTRRDGKSLIVSGGGESNPADLDMKKGDRVAFLTLHRRWGVSLSKGLPLWMRSDNLEVSPDKILDRYFDALGLNTAFQPKRRRARKIGVDAWGRINAILQCESLDGQWRGIDELEWVMLRQGMNPTQLLAQLATGEIDFEL